MSEVSLDILKPEWLIETDDILPKLETAMFDMGKTLECPGDVSARFFSISKRTSGRSVHLTLTAHRHPNKRLADLGDDLDAVFQNQEFLRELADSARNSALSFHVTMSLTGNLYSLTRSWTLIIDDSNAKTIFEVYLRKDGAWMHEGVPLEKGDFWKLAKNVDDIDDFLKIFRRDKEQIPLPPPFKVNSPEK